MDAPPGGAYAGAGRGMEYGGGDGNGDGVGDPGNRLRAVAHLVAQSELPTRGLPCQPLSDFPIALFFGWLDASVAEGDR